MMRVLHAPLEVAGQVGLMVEGLREAGFSAVGFNTFQNYLNYRSDMIETDLYQLQKAFPASLSHFDLFHFHNSSTFFTDHRDLPILAEQGKKIIMHHRGNDVRFSTLARRGEGYENPYVNTHSSLPDEVILRNLNFFSRHVSAGIVQDGELYHYVKGFYDQVYLLPRLIRLESMTPVYVEIRKNPLVIHAPTDQEFKGSRVIGRVVEELRREIPFQYILVEKMSHEEALEWYKRADLIIDQILCGAYGNLSVEGMALGKPVIAYIREDLRSFYPPDLPIVSANPDTLKERLKELLLHPELRKSLGEQGRRYVEKHHDARIVTKKLIAIYEKVLGG
ncbi:MAG: glycosyltransferase [Thermicanus sp.]|nr:glycosyltransferase [Thermicanus sp.]